MSEVRGRRQETGARYLRHQCEDAGRRFVLSSCQHCEGFQQLGLAHLVPSNLGGKEWIRS